MEVSQKTEKFLSALREYSAGALSQEKEIGLLLELAERFGHMEQFEKLAFLAKFVTGARKIMDRIGPKGEGYDKLSEEVTKSLQSVTSLLTEITDPAPDEVRLYLRGSYLQLTTEGLTRLLSLLSGLTWYKNWSIDHQNRRRA
jgi:hypothetical protein